MPVGRMWVAVAMILMSVGGIRGQASSKPVASSRAVEVQMRNVMYHFTDKVGVSIRTLRGQLLPTTGDIPVFDDKNSFTLQIASAEIAISPESLANVLNLYVFAKSDAPIKSLTIEIAPGGRVKAKGKLHSKGDIGFEMLGTLTATPDGKVRLHTEKVKALHLPVKGLMDLIGIKLEDLIKGGNLHGVEIEKDDLILDTETLLPPPHIAGKVTAVRVEQGGIVQVFGKPNTLPAMKVAAANYMVYRGNQLRFGKLIMTDMDMVIVDLDPKDPFDFFLDHYQQQLVAGYTKETPGYGLRVFMRDYNKLRTTTK
jgi:hypothetical protein